MTEWGIFSEDSADYTAAQSVEAGFMSRAEAERAIATRYSDEDGLTVHAIEDESDESEDDDE